jgi:hypothetical protein
MFSRVGFGKGTASAVPKSVKQEKGLQPLGGVVFDSEHG